MGALATLCPAPLCLAQVGLSEGMRAGDKVQSLCPACKLGPVQLYFPFMLPNLLLAGLCPPLHGTHRHRTF